MLLKNTIIIGVGIFGGLIVIGGIIAAVVITTNSEDNATFEAITNYSNKSSASSTSAKTTQNDKTATTKSASTTKTLNTSMKPTSPPSTIWTTKLKTSSEAKTSLTAINTTVETSSKTLTSSTKTSSTTKKFNTTKPSTTTTAIKLTTLTIKTTTSTLKPTTTTTTQFTATTTTTAKTAKSTTTTAKSTTTTAKSTTTTAKSTTTTAKSTTTTAKSTTTTASPTTTTDPTTTTTSTTTSSTTTGLSDFQLLSFTCSLPFYMKKLGLPRPRNELNMYNFPERYEPIKTLFGVDNIFHYKNEVVDDAIATFIGNGLCDPQFNNKGCLYDGGDCCLEKVDLDKCFVGGDCSCHFTQRVHQSWKKDLNCHAPHPNILTGNGACDPLLNTPECFYDGGDCCLHGMWHGFDHNVILKPGTEYLYCLEPTQDSSKSNHTGDLEPFISEIDDNFIDYYREAPPYIAAYRCSQFMKTEKSNLDYLPTVNLFFWAYVPSFYQLGNGRCNERLNVEACHYDFGDCCLPVLKPEICGSESCNCHLTDTKHVQIPESCLNKAGDGSCDDASNVPECGYDLGDCCRPLIKKGKCTYCKCNLSNKYHPPYTDNYRRLGNFTIPSQSTCDEATVSNGICNGGNNHPGCMWDGGDCCLPIVDASNCSISNCLCYFTSFQHSSPLDNGCTSNGALLGDGICHDSANNDNCMHDYGDCCLPIINPSSCLECLCRQDNSTHEKTISDYLNYLNRSDPFKEIIMGKEPLTDFNWIGFQTGQFGATYCFSDRISQTESGCDDIFNTELCQYDRGDCCLPLVDKIYCSVCLCHIDGSVHPEAPFVKDCGPQLIGDGICHGPCNVPTTNYDMGDCCLDLIIMNPSSNCSNYDCTCQMDASINQTYSSIGCQAPDLIGDKKCQDIANSEQCGYDHGDCCLPNILQYCNLCVCHQDNTVHPMTQYNYLQRIDKKWVLT